MLLQSINNIDLTGSIFSDKRQPKTHSIFSKLLHDGVKIELNEIENFKIEKKANKTKKIISSYLRDASVLYTKTLGKNSFGGLVDLDLLTLKKINDFDIENNHRKIESTYIL